MSKFIIPSASPLRKGVSLVLRSCGITAENISEDATATFFGVNAGGVHGLVGLVPALRCASEGASAEGKVLLGDTAEARMLINQWVGLSLQLCTGATTLPAVEHFIPSSNEFLAGPAAPTAADVIFFNACRWVTLDAASPQHVVIPPTSTVGKWMAFAERAPLIQSFLSEAPELASSAAASPVSEEGPKGAKGGAKGGKGAGFAIPNAEEIEKRRIEKEKARAEKEAAKAAAAAIAPAASASAGVAKAKEAAGLESSLLDIRVGKIIEIKAHPEADKLYVEAIDLGSEQRTIVSGLVAHYSPEQLLGRHCLVVCNMKPKPLKNVVSHGMVLCAGPVDGDTRVTVVSPPSDVPLGSRVLFGAAAAAPAPPAAPAIPGGNKMTELVAQLRSAADGQMHWGAEAAFVGGKPILAEIATAPIK